MKNERDSFQSENTDKKNEKKTLKLLFSLVIFLTLLVFGMGAALLTLFLNQKEAQQAKENENFTPSKEAAVITSPEERIIPSSEENIRPTPEANTTITPEESTALTPEVATTPPQQVTATPTPGDNTVASSQPNATNTNSVESQGLLFELQKCQKLNVNAQTQTIRCSVVMTSTQENVEVDLYSNKNNNRKSRIFEVGQESIAQQIQFGSDVSKFGRTKNNLITDVPIKAIFVFENVPLQTNKIDAFEISSYLRSSYYNNDIKVEFRDVIISDS